MIASKSSHKLVEEPPDILPDIPEYLPRVHVSRSVDSFYSADGGQENYDISGRIHLRVCYDNESLCVHVIEAKGLAGIKTDGYSDPYMKVYLLPDRSNLTKRRTKVQKQTNDPDFKEQLKVCNIFVRGL